ncbi:unnamed protein product [Lactuca virosa]|uniref:Uncharacterized protein n=1 Tax=Lactuca virosa TaxID=75947 RepID=A0AAU9MIF8_9ASTR|nr:unnamed protein product [Lactuca virosa]
MSPILHPPVDPATPDSTIERQRLTTSTANVCRLPLSSQVVASSIRAASPITIALSTTTESQTIDILSHPSPPLSHTAVFHSFATAFFLQLRLDSIFFTGNLSWPFGIRKNYFHH